MKCINIIILFEIFIFNCNSNKLDNKLNKIINHNKLKDDGSWVYILDNKKISTKEFEDIYQLFLKIISLQTGTSINELEFKSNSVKFKKNVLNRIINSELAFRQAFSEKLFKTKEGLNLLEIYRKQALNQYYFLKEIILKIKNPSNKELNIFYKKYKKEIFNKTGLKKIETLLEKKVLQEIYRKYKFGIESQKKIETLLLEKKIETNQLILKNYLSKKLTKDEILKNPKKYWLIKIDDRPILLSNLIYLIDFQIIQMNQKSKFIKNNINSERMLYNLKVIELVYLAAIDKFYHKEEEAKKLIKLIQKRSIALYYMIKNILSKISYPSKKEITKKLNDKKEIEILKNLLKKNNQKITKKNLFLLVKEKEYQKSLSFAQKKFIKKLREYHKIKISETYFQNKSDKIQKSILEKK